MSDWEDVFRGWAKPPGASEREHYENAETAVRNAIAKSEKLDHRNIKLFIQGSYRNNTNVRKDSDVDVKIFAMILHFLASLKVTLRRNLKLNLQHIIIVNSRMK